MGIPVLILGESGTGKTTSLRNFTNDEIGLVSVVKKPLPFRSDIVPVNSKDYSKISKWLYNNPKKTLVIDDSQYLICDEFMKNAKVKGYEKFTNMALNFYEFINFVIDNLPNDKIVYFLHHIDTENGNTRIKTIGKLLNEKVTVEGLCTIVLYTCVAEGEYTFMTQNNGHNTCKSPIGMFEDFNIPNDLKMVDNTIREYYNLNSNEKGND